MSSISPGHDLGRDTGPQDPVASPSKPRLLEILGPGLITGASGDDPSSIATYSQAGTQLGFSSLWTVLFSYPLMAVTKEISAPIGRTTGQGLAAILRRHYPPWLVQISILLLLVANVINLGADLAAMGDAGTMVLGGRRSLYVVLFGAICVYTQTLLQFARYGSTLKRLTLVFFAHFVLMVKVPSVPLKVVGSSATVVTGLAVLGLVATALA